MSLTNEQYDAIRQEYARRLAGAHRLQQERIKEVYQALPALGQIDAQKSDLVISAAKASLLGKRQEKESVSRQIAQLSRQAEDLLTEAGYPADYLAMPYTCSDCGDTGYIGNRKCHCFETLVTQMYYADPGVSGITGEEDFADFRLDYYPETMYKRTGDREETIRPREMMERHLRTCIRFARCFDSGPGTASPSLLLTGGVGLGKTFLSRCIAGEVMRSGHSVVYVSAAEQFRRLSDRFFSNESAYSDTLDHLAGCDLLIIDDLGTEVTNKVTSSILFQLLNRRIDDEKSTIISTNLDLQALSGTYSERSMSRIAGTFTILPFYGEDIRLKKKYHS